MEKIVRGVGGSIITAITVVLISTIIWALFFQPDPKMQAIFVGSIFATIISLIVSLVALAILGTPTFFVIQRMGINSAAAYIFLGVVFAMLIVAALLYPYHFSSENDGQRSIDALLAISSLIAAPTATLTFWKIVRPDTPPSR